MAPRKDTQRRYAWLFGLACCLCIGALSTPAAAAVAWKRVGTVSTLTPTQLCKTDGDLIICDGTTPTISATNQVGIGTAIPQSLLSIYGGGLALGSYAATTTIGTGSMVASGNIGIGTSLPLVTLDLSKRTDALALPVGTTGQEPSNSINGMIRYNTTLTDVEAYIGGYWTTLTTGGTGSVIYLGTSATVPNLAASASDTQTGFYTAGTGKVDVTSQGSQVVEISTSGMNVVTGKVGIGTASPGELLSLEKDSGTGPYLTLLDTNRIWSLSNDSSNFMVKTTGTGNYTTLESNSPQFEITTAGNVAIGTISPQSKLDVNGGVTIGTTYAGVNAAPSSGLIVQGNVGIGTTSPSAGTLHVVQSVDTISGGITISKNNLANSTRLWTDSSGNARLSAGAAEANPILLNGGAAGKVGIGTTSPSNTLDVSGGVAVGTQYVGVTTAPASGLLVQGNVGIGTTSPTAVLHVYGGGVVIDGGTGAANSVLQFSRGGTIAGAAVIAGSNGSWSADALTNDMVVRTQGTSQRILFNTNGGAGASTLAVNASKVGVGTSAPSSLLSVYGGGLALGTYAATTNIGTGSIVASGNIGVGTNLPQVTVDLSQRTDALALPVGTTGQEPSNSINGMIRYNTTLTDVEAYIGGYWTTLTTGSGGTSNNYLGTSKLVPNMAASASDTQTGLYTAGAGKVDFTSIGTQIVEISSSGMNVVAGNVGIGTSVSSFPLQVAGSGQVVAIGTSALTNQYFAVRTGGVGAAYFGVNSTSYNGSDNGFTEIEAGSAKGIGFVVGNDTYATSPSMYINSTGNVGIGTNAPNGKLTFASVYSPPMGSSYPQYDILLYDNGSAATSYGIGVEAYNMGFNTNGGYKFYQQGAATPIMVVGGQLSTNVGIGTTAPSNKLDVSGGVAIGTQYVGVTTAPTSGLIVQGNVGIGTTNSSYPLQVQRAAASGGWIIVGQTAGVSNTSGLWQDANNNMYFDARDRNGNLQVGVRTSGNSFLNGGNVGIGTASPASLLSVYGGGLAVGTYAATTNIGTGSLVASGNIGVGTNLPQVTVDLSQRTDALALPVGTTGQEPSNSINGMIRYNTTLTDVEAYIGGYWTTLTTGSGGTSNNFLGTSKLVPNMAASATDTQTGLYTAGAGKVDFTSIGTQIVEISSSGMNVVAGNVGIGTTSPQASFHVVGNGWINNGGDTLVRSTGLSVVGNPNATYANGTDPGDTNRTVSLIDTGLNKPVILSFRNTNAASSANFWDIVMDPNDSQKLKFSKAGSQPTVTLSSGSVGVGTTAPSNKLDVSGGEAIGASYVGSSTAPANGMIVQGNVGIGTTIVPTGPTVAINGSVQVAGTGSEPCNAATVGQMRYNASGQYMEICTYP